VRIHFSTYITVAFYCTCILNIGASWDSCIVRPNIALRKLLSYPRWKLDKIEYSQIVLKICLTDRRHDNTNNRFKRFRKLRSLFNIITFKNETWLHFVRKTIWLIKDNVSLFLYFSILFEISSDTFKLIRLDIMELFEPAPCMVLMSSNVCVCRLWQWWVWVMARFWTMIVWLRVCLSVDEMRRSRIAIIGRSVGYLPLSVGQTSHHRPSVRAFVKHRRAYFH
jgi:hypothetical protein